MTVTRYWYEQINDDLDPSPPFDSGWMVLGRDYDALAARLAEAERLLRLWFEYREPDDRLTAYSAKVEAFLRAADSAALSLSDYQCSSGRSAEDCMRWMSLSDGKAHCSRTDCTGPARISPVAKPDFWTIQD